MLKKMLWKMGTCSRLSERLIKDGRDSAARRVVSDTDTSKVLIKKGAQKEPSLLCPSLVMSYFTCSVRVGRRTAVVQVFVVLAGTAAGFVVGTGARVTVVYPLVSGC